MADSPQEPVPSLFELSRRARVRLNRAASAMHAQQYVAALREARAAVATIEDCCEKCEDSEASTVNKTHAPQSRS